MLVFRDERVFCLLWHELDFLIKNLISVIVFSLQADNLISVVDVDASSIVLSHRLTPLNTPPLEKMSHMHFQLQEIIIVGNSSEQVSFNILHAR